MEFRVGDKVRRIASSYANMEFGDIGIIESVSGCGEYIFLEEFPSDGHNYKNLELVPDNNNSIKPKKMEKKIYEVLTVNKKTGKTKKELVVADNEQSAILKAFGVDAENTFIKVTEEGKYAEEKPVSAVIVKEDKKKE